MTTPASEVEWKEMLIRIPAPMWFRLHDVADEDYNIQVQAFVIMALAKMLRKPRGPQTDLSFDWDVYMLWLKGVPAAKIADELHVALRTVHTRLEALGLRKPKMDRSTAAKKAWATKRAGGGPAMTPGAIRQREWRERQAERKALLEGPRPSSSGGS